MTKPASNNSHEAVTNAVERRQAARVPAKTRTVRCEVCGKQWQSNQAIVHCCSDVCRMERWRGQTFTVNASDLQAVFGAEAVEKMQRYYMTRGQQ